MSRLSQLFALGRPLVMGVLNVTPDSFSDGGEYLSLEQATSHAIAMLDDGADIIDVGGESTRPPGSAYGAGAVPVEEAEELDRIVPVIEAILKERPECLISIDTTKSSVAQRACELGAAIINDVSAGTADPEIFAVAKKCGVPLILMHGYGPDFHLESIEQYRYDDVVNSVSEFLADRIRIARESGVAEVLADVGIGFAKVYSDNMRLLKHHDRFVSLGVPMVLGVSRKSSVGRALKEELGLDVLPHPKARVTASLAAGVYGSEHGASIIRTHDVREMREALAMIRAIEGVE